MICHILKIEPYRQLEIQLDCSALVLTFKGILYFDVNFWALKCTVSGIQFPLFSIFFQSCFEHILSVVPHFFRPNRFFRAGGKFKFLTEPHDILNVVKKVKCGHNFRINLVWSAENVPVILLEPSYSCESSQCA